MNDDVQAIDALMARFYRAFDNRSGAAREIDVLYELFLPEATIVKNLDATPVVYDVRGFIEPRRALLSGGDVADFVEHELDARTDVFGHIAQRFSRYGKSWRSGTASCSGEGAKALLFVRTDGGWRIASLVWDDIPASP